MKADPRAARTRVALLLALTGCGGVDLDALQFSCTTDAQCAHATVCDLAIKICVPPDRVTDGGVESPADGGAPRMDASAIPQNSRCFPPRETITAATEAWWCTDQSTEAIEDLRARGGDMLDIHVESIAAGVPAFAVPFVHADVTPSPWFPARLLSDSYPPLSGDEQPWRTAGYSDAAGQTRFVWLVDRRFDRDISAVWYFGLDNQNMTHVADKVGDRQLRDLSTYHDSVRTRVSVIIDRPMIPERRCGFELELPVEALEAFLTDQRARAASIAWEHDPGSPTLSLSWTATAPGDLRTSIVTGVDAEALDREVRARAATVTLLAPYDQDGRRLYAAMLTRTPTSTADRVRAIMVDITKGTPAFVAQTETATLAARLADLRHDPGAALMPVLLLEALAEIERGRIQLDDPVALFDGTACATATSTLTEPVRVVLDKLVVDADRMRARALIEVLDARALAARAFALGVTVGSSVRCGRVASQWSLASAMRMWRELARAPGAFDRLLGASVDPRGFSPLVAELVTRELARTRLSGAARQAFSQQVAIRYTFGQRTSDPRGDLVTGLLRYPRCARGVATLETTVFGTFVEAPSTVGRGVAATERGTIALIRDVLRPAVEAWSGCP